MSVKFNKLKLFLYILLILILPFNIYGQDVKLKIDLGANKFEFLDYIYFTAIVKNESSEIVKITKSELWGNGPDIDIYLFDEKGNKYDNTITWEVWIPSYYELEPGAEIEFPLNEYYSLQFYMKGQKDFEREGLDIGKYKLKGILNTNRKKIESDWVEFEIIPIKDSENIDLFKEATKRFWDIKNPVEREKGVELYKEMLEISPSSILSLYAIDRLTFWYACNPNIPDGELENLKDKALSIYLNYFSDSRTALTAVNSVIGLFKRRGNETKTIEYRMELFEKTKNLKLKQKIIMKIEKQLPRGLRLIQSEKY